MRRMREVNRAKALPARLRVDMAQDANFDDDQLEEAVGVFDDRAPAGEVGWGISDLMDTLMTREPQRVPTDDVKTLQENLIEQGYVPPGIVADGLWNPSFAAAYRRSERDAFNETLEGNRIGSASLETAIGYLSSITPAGVWQGILGSAKGLVEQTGETVPRLGAAGGALAGAAIGTAIVPGAGTLVGAGVGAVAGFLGDFFAQQEDDAPDQDSMARFLDALSPWEEYKSEGGAGKFFEDLNLVVSAASLAKGGAMAVGGLRAGAGAIGTSVAHGTPLTQALLATPGAASKGIANALFTSTRAPLYGAAIGGGVGGVAGAGGFLGEGISAAEGAAGGAVAGAALGFAGKLGRDPIQGFFARQGFLAQVNRPLLKTVNKTFTGLAAGTVGARLASDIIPGVSKFEETLEAEPYRTGPLHVGEWSSFLIWPSQFLPMKGGDTIRKIANSKMFKDPPHFSYDVALRTTRGPDGKMLSARERLGWIRENITPEVDHKLRVEAGIKYKVREEAFARQMPEEGGIPNAEFIEQRTHQLAQQVNDEWAAVRSGQKVETPVQDELVSWTRNGPDPLKGEDRFIEHLMSMGGGRGRGIQEGLAAQIQAEHVATRANRLIETQNFAVRVGDDGASVFRRLPTEEAASLKASAGELRGRANKIRPEAAEDPVAAQAEKRGLLDQAEALEKQLDTIPEQTFKAPFAVTVANKNQPELGIWGSPTEQEISRLVDDVDGFYQRLDRARKALKDADHPDPQGVQNEIFEVLRDAVNGDAALLKQLHVRGLITDKRFQEANRLLQPQSLFGEEQGFKQLKEVASELIESQHLYPTEIPQIPDEIASILPEGKTLVLTGKGIVRFDDVPETLASFNIDEYLANKNIWDSVGYYARQFGLSPHLRSDQGLFGIRVASQEAAVNDAIRTVQREIGQEIPLNGRNLLRMVRNGMDEFNGGEGVVPGPGVIRQKVVTPSGEVKPVTRRPLLDVRRVTPEQIKEWAELDTFLPSGIEDIDQFSNTIYHAIKKGSALGGEMDVLRHPLDSIRSLGRSLELDGVPGFVDWARTWHIQNPTAFGAVTGAGAGALVGKEEGKALQGAIIGGVLGGGVGTKWGKNLYKKGHYGYLPEALHNASMALRYTFSVAFDAGRYMENATLMVMREGGPFVISAPRHIKGKQWESLFGNGMVTGEDAMREAYQLSHLMRGGPHPEATDEMLQWMFQRGVLGYAPRSQEAARAYMIAQRHVQDGGRLNKSFLRDLHERTRMLEGYGLGRTTVEKSVNFVFFPFSFQKKLLSSLGDFILQAPGRGLLIHEGYRRMQETGAMENAGDFIEKYIPLANQMKKLNNLSYGLSPGRFFLQGQMKNKTDLGNVLQALSQVYVPSGANTPLAQLFGGLGDSAVHLFSPVVVSSETGIDEARETIEEFVPAVRDIARFASGLSEQATAITPVQTAEGTRLPGAPYYQLQQYVDGKRLSRARFEPVAKGMGFSSLEGFLASDAGAPIKALLDREELELGSEYRKGKEMANQFENSAATNKQALYELASDPTRTAAEDTILQLAQMESVIGVMTQNGLPSDTAKLIMHTTMRNQANELASDPEFLALWSQFFEYNLGPLTRTKVA